PLTRYWFIFTAEERIRDFHVTGVQTCALPISRPRLERGKQRPAVRGAAAHAGGGHRASRGLGVGESRSGCGRVAVWVSASRGMRAGRSRALRPHVPVGRPHPPTAPPCPEPPPSPRRWLPTRSWPLSSPLSMRG